MLCEQFDFCELWTVEHSANDSTPIHIQKNKNSWLLISELANDTCPVERYVNSLTSVDCWA